MRRCVFHNFIVLYIIKVRDNYIKIKRKKNLKKLKKNLKFFFKIERKKKGFF